MRKKLMGLFAVLILTGAMVWTMQVPEREVDDFEVFSGACVALPGRLTYPGGTGLQIRLARWYNLNLSAEQPEKGFRDAYVSLLRAEEGYIGYVVLGAGGLAYPFRHEGVDGEGFCHDSGSAFPVSHRGERTVLRWQGGAASREIIMDMFSLEPGSFVTIHILDRDFTYMVADGQEDQDSASCLELVFCQENGDETVVTCKCIQVDTHQ